MNQEISQVDEPKRPPLTFPSETADFVKTIYSENDIILEYGSGGSTVLASEMDNKIIVSTESDKQWAKDLESYIKNNPRTKSLPKILSVDIGQTTHWGWPANYNRFNSFYSYSTQPWINCFNSATDSLLLSNLSSEKEDHPDVILIDGRFRLACFLVSCFFCRKESTILFDDYTDRPHYEKAEIVSRPESFAGRMAIFQITPKEFTSREMELLFSCLTDPR